MPPPTVVTDTNVTSAWGNAVVAELANHNSQLGSMAVNYANLNAAKAGLGTDNVFTGAQFINSTGLTGGYPGLDKQGFYLNAFTGWMRINNHGGDTSTSGITITLSGPGDFPGKRYMVFGRYTTEIGSIQCEVGSSSVGYYQTSDPRLKTPPDAPRAQPLMAGGDAASRVQQLGSKAWVGHWIDPISGATGDDDVDFLSSWDIEDVAPYAVSGERDAVAGPPQNEGEPEEGAPVYQQVDYPSLVPLLTAALSQALDRIDALEARVTALESA